MTDTTTHPVSPALLRYCEACLRRGLTLRTALAAYRAAGGRIRTQTFCRAWQQARQLTVQDAWDRLSARG